MGEKFPSISLGATTVVALESVGSKTMNRKMKSTSQGDFDSIPGRRDQPTNRHNTYNSSQ